jgi:hypothetical protein
MCVHIGDMRARCICLKKKPHIISLGVNHSDLPYFFCHNNASSDDVGGVPFKWKQVKFTSQIYLGVNPLPH